MIAIEQWDLTPQQYAVLKELCTGKSNPEISKTLSIAVVTVEKHLTSIYEKLGVSGRTEAVLVATGILRR